jgi:hypothetical protein
LRIILLFLSFNLTILANTLSAQDFFELTYQFKNDTTKTLYRGFLARYPGDTGFVRLTAINKKTQKRVLYDFSISLNPYEFRSRPLDGGQQLTDSTGGTYWYCWSESFNLKEGAEIHDFDYLRFWFKLDTLKQIIEPCLKTPFNVAGRNMGLTEELRASPYPLEPDSTGSLQQRFEETGILNFKQLKNPGFTKTYLRDFFTSSELFYEGTYTKKQISASRNNIKPVLYLVLVVNTEDADIRASCIADSKRVKNYFTMVTDFLGLPLPVVKQVQGKNFTVNGVKAAIKSIHPKSDDIIVFHYSGHGFSFSEDADYPFPQLALWHGDAKNRTTLRESSINMEQIFTDIKAKGARLNLVMSDCCNTLMKARRSSIYDTAREQYPPGYYYMNRRAAISLFLQARTSLLISAAKKGQKAFGSKTYDGIFSTSMINSIRLGLKTTGYAPQWFEIIKKAEDETMKLAVWLEKVQNIIYRVCDTKTNAPCVEDVGYKTGK